MRFGDTFKAPVGFQSSAAAPDIQPMSKVGFIDRGEEKFFFVVSVKAGDLKLRFKADNEFDDAFGVGSAIDVVAHEDEVVICLRGNDFD